MSAQVLIKRRTLLLCWLLLVGATVALGLLARHSIRTQETLVRQELRDQLRRQAETQSVDLGRFIDDVLGELMETLRVLDQGTLDRQLARLAATEPFVARTFIIQSNGRILLPEGLSYGGTTLMARLAATRQQHPQWPGSRASEQVVQESDAAAQKVIAPEALPQMRRRAEADETVRSIASRQQISRSRAAEYSLGVSAPTASAPPARASLDELFEEHAERRESTVDSKVTPPSVPERTVLADGWSLWPETDEPQLLGWVEVGPDKVVYAAVLDMKQLAERLAALLPSPEENALSTRIITADGQVLVQSGKASAIAASPDFRYGLGSVLSGWTVEFVLDSSWDSATASIQALGQWVLLAMVSAILGGGTLLLWQAERARRDALQKANFVSTVSHELRTPLTSIQLYAGMLAEDRINDGAKRVEYGHRILGESSRLSRLVTNLLNHQKATGSPRSKTALAGGAPLALTPWLEKQSEHLRVFVEGAGLTLDASSTLPPAATVQIDRDALEQCLTNLVDNAVKYAGRGKQVSVTLSADASSKLAVLEVADDGPGVPAEKRKHIFKPFYQCDRKLTETQSGLGIGLSLCRSTIEAAGGRITCQAVGKAGGACFRIELPLATQEA